MKNKFSDDTFLARWLSGDLSAEELAAFEADEDFETYKKIALASAQLKTPAWDKQKNWAALSEQLGSAPTAEQPAKVRRLGGWWRYAAAACALLIAGYFIFFNKDSLQSYSTPMASQETIELPDGSTVQLNADSKLSFDQTDFLEERTLNLQGEAFFSVVKGSPFTVQTKNGDVRVLGTSFNVRARNQRMNLTCYTGKVGLSFDTSGDMIILTPGDQVIAENRRILEKRRLENEDNPAWMQGQSRFVQVDFVDVIQELERQFDVEISYPSSLNQLPKYSGGFPHQNLETALNIVFSPTDYEYKINGRKVIITK